MKTAAKKISFSKGTTLVESSIAMGILAVAVPLVFGSMAEAGKSGSSAEAETRCAWMIPACLQEIENSRAGRPQYFAATETGEAFPTGDEIWALAFSSEGSVIGKISAAEYKSGIRNTCGKMVSHIANIRAHKLDENDRMLGLRITLEYPAAAPAGKRRTLDFHSRIP